MEITHNKINGSIRGMESIVSKGQPFAKRNKDKRIRAVLREMRVDQTTIPTLKEVWFYFRMWLRVTKPI